MNGNALISHHHTRRALNLSEKITAQSLLLLLFVKLAKKLFLIGRTSFGKKPWPEIRDNATAHARDYLAIWPPNTQRKCMAEIKQNKIEQVLAYREQMRRCGRVLENFLRYSDKLLFINKCYWPSFSSMFIFEAWLIQCSILQRLEIQNLHPKQMLIRHSRQHNRDIPSAAIA